MVSFTKSSPSVCALKRRGRGGKIKLPEEQQLNENSSLNPKRVHSSRNPANKDAVVCFPQPRCRTGALTSAGSDPNLCEEGLFVWK